GFPVNGFIECDQFGLYGGGANKPAIQWIIEYRLVSPPAMGVTVLVFFNLEGFIFFFQFDCNQYIGGFKPIGRPLFVAVVFFFDEPAAKLTDFLNKPAPLVDNGGVFAVFIFDKYTRYIVFLTHAEVIRTERGRSMYNTGTVFDRDKIARNDPESLLFQFLIGDIRQQLVVAKVYQFGS